MTDDTLFTDVMEGFLDRITALMALPVGWDGYDGVPVSVENAAFAMGLLGSYHPHENPPVFILAGVCGDIQLEWHGESGDIELHVVAPHVVEAWHRDERLGWEGETVLLTTDFTVVAQWLTQLALGADPQEDASSIQRQSIN